MSSETRAAFAARCGVNKSTVTRWAEAGALVLAENGRDVQIEASLQRLAERRGIRPDVAARHAAGRGRDIPSARHDGKNAPAGLENATAGATESNSAPQLEALGVDGNGSRTKYKTIALHYENQAIKLEMALRRGLRYPKKSVEREAIGLGATVRAAMERLIDQTAPRLAVMRDPLARRALIEQETRRIQRMLRGELPRILRRLRTAAEKSTSGASE